MIRSVGEITLAAVNTALRHGVDRLGPTSIHTHEAIGLGIILPRKYQLTKRDILIQN